MIQASEEVTEELGKFIKEYTSVEAWKLAEEAGMEIYDVSDEVVAEVKSRLTPLTEKWLEEQEKAGYPAREIYKQFLEAYEGY